MVNSAGIVLEEAVELVKHAGLSIDYDGCSGPKCATNAPAAAAASTFPSAIPASSTTGGHSNTDHIVFQTGDPVTDRIEELKRNHFHRTHHQQQHTESSAQKWDKPRAAGERRRRVQRDDLNAPAEPPPSGYIIFVGQMTTKIRHDRSGERHNQTAVVQEISKVWRINLSDEDQKYYHEMADYIRTEYKTQYLEYRATGSFTPSDSYKRVGNFWTHRKKHEKNDLELELDTYDTVLFPPRPPEFDDEYRKREEESKRRRKLKLKGLDSED